MTKLKLKPIYRFSYASIYVLYINHNYKLKIKITKTNNIPSKIEFIDCRIINQKYSESIISVITVNKHPEYLDMFNVTVEDVLFNNSFILSSNAIRQYFISYINEYIEMIKDVLDY